MAQSIQLNYRESLEKIRKKADLMCSCYAIISERQRFLSDCIQITVIFLSAISFSLPIIETIPFFDVTSYRSAIIGISSSMATILTSVHLYLAPDKKAASNETALKFYSDINQRIRNFLSQQDPLDETEAGNLLEDYMRDTHLPAIPHKDFLKLKRSHKIEVSVSKLLDDFPGMPIFIVSFVLIFRDSCKGFRKIFSS